MNKYTYLVAIFFVALVFSCKNDDDANSSPEESTFMGEIEFVKTIGGTKNEAANAVVKTEDGGYAILGYTQSMDNDIVDKQNESFDYWVVKYDAQDQLQWSKTYGGTQDDRGNKIITTPDGGFAILGYSFSSDEDVTNNQGLQDFWLAKLDALGTILWQKSFGFAGADKGISLINTQDGGYFLTGILDVTASGGAGNSKQKHAGGDFWAIQLDASGTLQWSKYYGGSLSETPNDVIQTEDNGYIIVGASDSEDVDISNNKGSYDFWVVKISENGTLQWEKSFGGTEIDEAYSITKTNDNNYLIVGDTRSNDIDVASNYGAADIWVIKISPAGELLQQKNFGGSGFDNCRSIKKTEDNHFLLAGSSRSSDGNLTENQGQNDAWIIKINANLELVYNTTIGGSNIEVAYDIAALDNQKIIAVGSATSQDGDIDQNLGFTDTLILKIK